MIRRISMMTCCYIQIVIIIASILVVNIAPPPRGAMMLVSISGLSTGAMLNHALAAGAAPLRGGPIPGSLVVFGNRSRLLAAGLPAGIIVLSSAATALCGEKPVGGARP